jgi:hypothetical protein
MINQRDKGYSFVNGYLTIYKSFDKIYNKLELINFNSDTIYFASNDKLGNIPEFIKKIIFCELSREPDDIPNSVEHLEFLGKFDHPLNNLPSSIKSIKLGNQFNKPLNNLPQFVEKLVLGGNFNHTLCNLPKSINYLEICIGPQNFQTLKTIPDTITHLVLDLTCLYPFANKILLSNSITHLRIKGSHNYDKIIIPNNITHLHLPHGFDKPLNNLPDSIEYISVGRSFKKTKFYYQCKYKGIMHFF